MQQSFPFTIHPTLAAEGMSSQERRGINRKGRTVLPSVVGGSAHSLRMYQGGTIWPTPLQTGPHSPGGHAMTQEETHLSEIELPLLQPPDLRPGDMRADLERLEVKISPNLSSSNPVLKFLIKKKEKKKGIRRVCVPFVAALLWLVNKADLC